MDKLAAAAEFWVGLHKHAVSPGQAAMIGGGALLAGGTGALLQHANATPRAGGKSKEQVAVEQAQQAAMAQALNAGEEPGAPGLLARLRAEHADWAAQNPGAASGVAAVPWALAGGLAGNHLHELWRDVRAAQALRPG